MFYPRGLWSLALLASLAAAPAVAQTRTDMDQPPHDQRQSRTEAQHDESGTSPYSATSTNRPRITADVQTQPQQQLSGEEKQALSQAAARLLAHVDKARQAIESNDKEQAIQQVNKGLILARIIERTAPVSQVNATIRAGDLVYEDQDTVKMTSIPIYAELGEVSVWAPVEAAKREVAKSQAAKVPVVQDVEFQHTAVTLDAMNAKRHLKAAKAALADEKPELADQALAAIQSTGVSFTYTEMDLPLIRTRENLTLAKNLVMQQRPEAARIALQEAARALSAYNKHADQSQASQVQELRQRITELSQNVENNQADAAEQISRLWDKVTQLAG